MTGAHRIVVETKKIKYDFTINRQINLLIGDSGTGKTTLCDLIETHNNNKTLAGLRVDCDVPCKTLSNDNWQDVLNLITGSIVFIDESSDFVNSEQFAHAIRHSDNYYVIINRRKLSNLPYSIHCIFGLRVPGKYNEAKQVYNELYRVYSGNEIAHKVHHPDTLITEDIADRVIKSIKEIEL